MILATHGIVGSQILQIVIPTVSDADAQSFVDRVYLSGGVLSATELTAINTLVIQMKADGIWTKMKAIYPMVGASAAACSQNLKSSSFTGTFTSGWTFSSTGVTGNGTSAYFDTNFKPNNSNYLDFSWGYYIITNSDGVLNEFGLQGSNTLDVIYDYPKLSNEEYLRYASNDITRINPGDIRGFHTANQISSVLKKYKNGSSVNSNTRVPRDISALNINYYISARNNNGTAALFSNRTKNFAFIGDGLTDTEVSKYYTAVQAFQTTLSRNV